MTESTPAKNTDSANPRVALETGLGRIVIEVYDDRAPKNSAYFLGFVAIGAYDGGSFYRAGASVAADAHPSRIIQGGFLFNAATGEFALEQNGSAMKMLAAFETTDESGITHVRGTVPLGRDLFASGDGIPDFFICTGDSPVFDVNGRTEPDTLGFPAFGKVIEGIDVVEKIVAQETGGIVKTEAVKGQILTEPVPIEKAYRR
jgi:peptidyl-prolyl cis-trans isomerase A (cyclophilin A)